MLTHIFWLKSVTVVFLPMTTSLWDFWWFHSYRGTEPAAWHKHRIAVTYPDGASVGLQWLWYHGDILRYKRRWARCLRDGLDPTA
jgi:hypothetical protein